MAARGTPSGGAISGLSFPSHRRMPGAATIGPRVDDGFDLVARELGDLAGERRPFTVPVAPAGTTRSSAGSGIC